jgi:sporulation and spore germination protein
MSSQVRPYGALPRAARAPGARARVALLACVALVAIAAGCRPKGGAGSAKAQPTPTPTGPTEKAAVSLLFPGVDGFLHAETREVSLPLAADARVATVIATLLAGPQGKGLVAPLPPGVTVADAFLDADGVVYLDLAAPEQPAPPPSGSDLELLRVYSLVDTVAANEPRARSVVLLWNGAQRDTFAGHIDTGAPLREDRRWVK